VTARRSAAAPPLLLAAAAAIAFAGCSGDDPTPPDPLVGTTYRLEQVNDSAVPYIFNVTMFGAQRLDSAHLRFSSQNRVLDMRYYTDFLGILGDTQVVTYSLDGDRLVLSRPEQPGRPARADTGLLLSNGISIPVERIGFTQRRFRMLYERR
jgi:hypothetical protein